MRSPVLVFDIESITDRQAGKQLYQLDLSDDDTDQALLKIRRQESGQDFQRLALHEIVCISGLWYANGQWKLFSWTQQQYSEAEIIDKFFKIFQRYQPQLITWNGSQYDLPLLMLRGMIHGLSAPALWDQGELHSQKRYNNYVNRYHFSHIDLMDNMAMFHQKHFAKMDDIAVILGLAGKGDESGYLVADYVKQGKWQQLQNYCEGDVVNTWLIYLRWLLLKGQLNAEQHQFLVKQTQHELQQRPEHQDFLQRWQKNAQYHAFSRQFFE
ncbi:MAG: 3'-5' exonuclease [Acinetobacter sp.]|nr:3'-5' exonuclease [Acinetobacter sp.]MDO4223883.1 3'-5' exonuclease [Acinetobacter sp.]